MAECIEPVWTMLEFNSFNALLDEPSASNDAIRLQPNLAEAEMSGSAIVANALSYFDEPPTQMG